MSTLRLTSPAASPRNCSAFLASAGDRNSNSRFLPGSYPSSRRRPINTSVEWRGGPPDARYPILGRCPAGCASMASGAARRLPPSPVRKARRSIPANLHHLGERVTYDFTFVSHPRSPSRKWGGFTLSHFRVRPPTWDDSGSSGVGAFTEGG